MSLTNKNSWSFSVFIAMCLFLFCSNVFFYPKWQQSRTEATLSWDVSGYYFYLPAIFIYDDIGPLKFKDDILQKYGPTPELQQAYLHHSGNYIMKYSCGMAVQYLPFFLIAHAYATMTDYEADGFSKPYQVLISLGSLLIAFIGLWYLRKSLLEYFSDKPVAMTLLTIVMGSNYLDYSAINGAMSHNYLFTIYAVLIWQTIQFYRKPNLRRSIFIGALVGIAALTRPTDIIALIIPLCWGLKGLNKNAIIDRLKFLKVNYRYLASAIVTCMLIGSLQIIYWKIAGNEWIIYSYEDQGFSWLRPHIIDGLFSYKTGWLIYSPILIFSLVGFIFLYKKYKSIFWACFLFSLLFIYITVAWDIWWYGGGLGLRAMVQSYAVLAFPLAACMGYLLDKKKRKYGYAALLVVAIYYNLWLTYQAHIGGLFLAGQTTKAYFWKTLGRYEKNIEHLKLLDNRDTYYGTQKDVVKLYENNFNDTIDSLSCQGLKTIEGNASFCLEAGEKYSPVYKAKIKSGQADRVRARATIRSGQKEWDIWKSHQMIIKLKNGDNVVRERGIKLFRILNDQDLRSISIDIKTKNKEITDVELFFWNPGSQKSILIDELTIESYRD